MKKHLAVAFALIFFISTSSQATTVERLTLDALVKKASSIVVGKVMNSRTYWSDNRKLILTSYIFAVQETIKGQPGPTIELTTIGGTVGDVTLHVAGMPMFEKDEDAVVFVERSGAFSTVVGLSQGKFALANGEVINNMTDLEFPDGREAKPLRMPLQSFKSRIKVLLTSQP